MEPLSVPRLTERHLQDLRKSGLSDEQIDACGFYSVRNTRDAARILRWSRANVNLGDCLAIPFYDADGVQLDYTRLKPDQPREIKGKKVRYESPRQASNRAYFPPKMRSMLMDASVPLVITEGEKKAAKADQEGFCCVGLVGVYGWQVPSERDDSGHAIGPRVLIDDLRQLPLRGRSVWVCYDSDAIDKPQVMLAEWHLAETLMAKGASVKVCRLPRRPGESNGRSKVGLDDFLVERGVEAFHRVLMEAGDPVKPLEHDGPQEAIDDPARLARLFIEQRCTHADGVTLRYHREQWWKWDGYQYRQVSDAEMAADVCAFAHKEFIRANLEELAGWEKKAFSDRGNMPMVRKVSKGLVSNVELAMTPHTIVPTHTDMPAWLGEGDRSRNWVSLRNGVIDVDKVFAGDRKLLPHTPLWFSPTCLPYDFVWGAESPKWDAFLRRNLEGDVERIEILQEFAGLLTVHDTNWQKFLLMSGEGSDGKSVVCAVLEAVVGSDNCSHVPLENFGERFNLTSSVGKLANIVTEIGEMDKVSEGFLKSFTSGDAMQFDRKHKEPIEARPTARLVLSTNNPPRLSDRSDGVWRRMIAMPFRVRMDENDPARVHGMTSGEWWRDQGELPGIFFWALLGLQRLRQQKAFTRSALCDQFLSDYRVESNPARTFLMDTCSENADGHIPCGDLYDSYRAWCRSNGNYPLAASTFGKEVFRAFPRCEKKRIGGRSARDMYYCGIDMVDFVPK